MKTEAFVGVDPGASGAIAVYVPVPGGGDDLHNRGNVVVVDMPALEIAGKRRLDLYALAGLVKMITSDYQVVRAAVEDVHAMPKQGVSSSFAFGFAAGAIQAALAAYKVSMVLVRPVVWKKYYNLPKGDKDAARRQASRLFPNQCPVWARKKDHGRAESSLLAYYNWKHPDLA